MEQRNTAATEDQYVIWRARCMKHKKTNTLAALFIIVLGIWLTIGPRTARALNIYVTKSGNPAPTGEQSAPYHMVEAGIVRAKSSPGSTVLIGPGKYYETLTIDTPCTLVATGGTVTIGKLDYQASTTLRIITLNTHLAGDEVFMPSWVDCWRADDIADFIKALDPKPDVVAFQEIWDEDLFKGGDCDGAIGIRRRSGCTYGEHGEEEGDIMNSGLALMSNYSLSGFAQVEWNAEGGDWPTAKGYIRATIIKDGFSIGLFNLHTKAGYDVDDRNIRWEQLQQLVNAVNEYRVNHRDHVVFVMGDFNVKGEGSEYYPSLIGWMELAEGKDADRNSPGFIVDRNFKDQWTSDDRNLLAYWFGSGDNARLDYIYYIQSLDGSVEVLPAGAGVLRFRGRDYQVCVSRIIDPFDIPRCIFPYRFDITNESSDHWSVYGRFKLYRR